jgi:hypothetical protein
MSMMRSPTAGKASELKTPASESIAITRIGTPTTVLALETHPVTDSDNRFRRRQRQNEPCRL